MMNYVVFFASSGQPKITSTPDFITKSLPKGRTTTDISLFDLRFLIAKNTMTPAPYALQVAKRNFEEWFRALAGQWTRETGHIASISKRKQHAAYQSIVQLGDRVVPLLLDSLRTRPDFWFPALRDITGENPVGDQDRGYYDRMANAWIEWGRARQLIA